MCLPYLNFLNLLHTYFLFGFIFHKKEAYLFCMYQLINSEVSFCFLFFKFNFFKEFFQEHNQSVKQFGSKLGTMNVGSDLGPNCLQRLSADDKTCHK